MFLTTTNLFFWKHYKSIKFQWISNVFNIAIPILLTFGQIYLFRMVGTLVGDTALFDPLSAVRN